MPALDLWEQRLKLYFDRPLRIIGEIAVTRAEVEELSDEVKLLLKNIGMSLTTRVLIEGFPHAFLVLLTGFAAHNTEKAYWIALGERLDVSHTLFFNHGWHTFYLKEVKRRGLRFFEHEEAHNNYVATIRFHGGIPAYSLPDFFERLLLHAVRRPELNELPTAQALAVVLKTAYFVDSPVINFLVNSGKLGEEFFNACRRMARHYLQSQGDLLPAAELGLPEYVVNAFGDYMERGESQQTGRLRRPVLFINPFADLDRVWLKLPELEIPSRFSAAQFEWQVSWTGLQAPHRILCPMRRRGQESFISENAAGIGEPVPQVNIALTSCNRQQDVLHRWNLPLAPASGHAPLIAFRTDGQQVRPGRALPAERLILMYPKDATIKVDGSGKKSEEYGEMEGAWNGWQVHEWDLSQAESIQITQQEIPVGPVVPVAGRQALPELWGGTLAPFDQGEVLLYLDVPPAVRIPIEPGIDLSKELKKWKLDVKSLNDTYPEGEWVITLGDYAEKIKQEDNFAGFPLSHVLGKNPIGTFALHLIRHGEVAGEFELRVCPWLEITGLSVQILPSEKNNQPVTFSLHSKAGCKIQVEPGIGKAVETVEGWQITAEPDTVDLAINLYFPVPGKKFARVPLQIPIPRLQWALVMDRDPGSMEWTNQPLQKSAAAILDCDSAALHVKAHGLRNYSRQVRLELVELDEKKIAFQEGIFQPTFFSPDWLRIPLGQFSDTLRNKCQQSLFEFVIPPSGDISELRVSLLQVPRQMVVKNVAITGLNETSWKITWEEEHPLRNRRLMLVAPWQPWREPMEYKVADESKGEIIIENGYLDETRYAIYFYVSPAWKPSNLTPPTGVQSHVWDFVTPAKRIQALDLKQGENAKAGFYRQFEIVCIYHELNEPEKRDLTIGSFTSLISNQNDLDLILSFLEWLNNQKIKTSSTYFLWQQIYKSQILKSILNRYSAEDPLLQRYLKYLRDGIEIEIDGRSALLIAERFDEPIIIRTCIKQLIRREDKEVIPLLLFIMKKDRFSKTDVIDLLSNNKGWVINQLSNQVTDSTVIQLLSMLHPHYVSSLDISTIKNSVLGKFLLTFPNRKEKIDWFVASILNDRDDGFRGLMKAYKARYVFNEEIRDILLTVPNRAIEFLLRSSYSKEQEDWLNIISREYPGFIGSARNRTKLVTQLGIGIVRDIHDSKGIGLAQVPFTNRSAYIVLDIMDQQDIMTVVIDFVTDMITFKGVSKAWQCGYCNYIHSQRAALDRHYVEDHHTSTRIYLDIGKKIRLDRSKLKAL